MAGTPYDSMRMGQIMEAAHILMVERDTATPEEMAAAAAMLNTIGIPIPLAIQMYATGMGEIQQTRFGGQEDDEEENL